MSVREPDRDKNWIARNLRWVLLALATIGILLAVAEVRGANYQVFNVATDSSGGTISQGQDIAAALQEGVDQGLPVYIPPGHWNVSTTVTTPYKAGLELFGAGASEILGSGSAYFGRSTILRWSGAANGVMFELTGTNYRFGNFTVDGQGNLDTAVKVFRPEGQSALGSGKHWFTPMYFHDVNKAGVEMGRSTTSNNSDLCWFEWLGGDECEAIYYSRTNQALGNVIQYIWCRSSNTYAVEMDAGSVRVLDASVVSPLTSFIKVNDVASGFGPNNGEIIVEHLKVDQGAGQSFQFIDCDSAVLLRIYLNGGHQQEPTGGYTGTFAALTGSNVLNITNYTGWLNSITGTPDATYGTPSVYLQGCNLRDSNPETVIKSPVRWRRYGAQQLDADFLDDIPRRVIQSSSDRGERGITIE